MIAISPSRNDPPRLPSGTRIDLEFVSETENIDQVNIYMDI